MCLGRRRVSKVHQLLKLLRLVFEGSPLIIPKYHCLEEWSEELRDCSLLKVTLQARHQAWYLNFYQGPHSLGGKAGVCVTSALPASIPLPIPPSVACPGRQEVPTPAPVLGGSQVHILI